VSTLGLVMRQIGFENRSFWRNPVAAFFTFFFPLMFLFLFPNIFGDEDIDYFGRTISLTTFYVPAIAAFSVITACYTNLAMSITFLRDEGVLKRKRGTPMPSWAYLSGRIVHSTLIGLLLVAIVVVVGAMFFDVEAPDNTLGAFIVTVAIGSATFSALGMAIAALVPNSDAAPAVINFSVLPLLFISNVFIPIQDAPEWLKNVAEVFPIYHFAEAMLESFNPFREDAGFEWGHLAVVIVWGVGGLLFALRKFTWEPRR
jgi:ABC-2 type transport system permease protein